MKRFFKTVAIVLLCGALAVPMADAQSRGRNNGGGTRQPASTPNQTTQRPGSPSSRPSTPGGSTGRPGNMGNAPGNHNPGNQRPGNHNPGGQRPGGHNPGNQRPGNHNPGGQRPGGHTPGNRPVNPGYRPGGPQMGHRPPGHPPYGHGPQRPHVPHRPFYRPAPPPPGWHPAPGWRPITSILGISIGTAFNISLNALLNTGYNVSSYGNDVIYLNNVQMLNMNWPSATLFFNNVGQLYASRFVYQSSIYDTSRYDMAYTMLMRNYGMPVSVNNSGNRTETTWWGPNNQFINLSFVNDYSSYGYPTYYTVLSFGN